MFRRTDRQRCDECKSTRNFDTFLSIKGAILTKCQRCRDIETRRRWRQRLKVLALFGSKCWHCGERNKRLLEFDHITPIRSQKREKNTKFYGKILRAGYDDNIQLLCSNCHTLKTLKDGRVTLDVRYQKYVESCGGENVEDGPTFARQTEEFSVEVSEDYKTIREFYSEHRLGTPNVEVDKSHADSDIA